MGDTRTCQLKTLCVILARAGSKGLPNKNVLNVAGRPMIAWTLDHAQAAQRRGAIDRIVVSTDGEAIAEIARGRGVAVVMRPADLASDTATVDAAARHAVGQIEAGRSKVENVVILYANVPVRPDDLIDRALTKLRQTGCDSVQSVCPVGKMHPFWMKTLDGDALQAYVENAIYRRQDLPPVYQLDGGIIAVSRASLFTVKDGEPHAFLGFDRRAVVAEAGGVVDVDEPKDVAVAEALLTRRDRRSNARFVIRERPVGEGQPVYVIAEIGVNHDGSVERAVELVHAAKAAGADAIKLQLFTPSRLLSAEAELAAYQDGAADSPLDLLASLQLSVDEMLMVRQAAHARGLAFIVTPFSLEDVGDMRRLDPDAVKIASPDCVNLPLLRAMRRVGKPMIVSTGAATVAEVAEMARHADWPSDAAIMHCVSAYPTPSDQAGLAGIAAKASLGGGPAGYSDHTTDPDTGMLAVAAGAKLIEKHLTHDRRATGPDHSASFDPDEFADYVRRIRRAEAMVRGDGEAFASIERDVRRVSRQSVCAVRDLEAGHVIGRDDVTVKRPGTGIPAGRLDDVIGRTVLREVGGNRLLRDEDVDWS